MKKIIASLGFFAPAIVFAQTTTFTSILGVIQGILNVVMPILITLGVVYFLWGVVQYVTSGDAEKKEEGQQHMIWGLIGIFVMVALWGLIAVISNTFGISGTGGLQGSGGGIPCVVDSDGNPLNGCQ